MSTKNLHSYNALVEQWRESDVFPFASVEEYFKQTVSNELERDMLRLEWIWDHISYAFSLVDGIENDEFFDMVKEYHTKLDTMSSDLLNLTEGLKDEQENNTTS